MVPIRENYKSLEKAYQKLEPSESIDNSGKKKILESIHNTWLTRIAKFRTDLCVQLRLVCSAGDRPVRVKARSPVARIAGRRVTKSLKPIDKVTLGVMSKLSGRNASKRIGGLVIE